MKIVSYLDFLFELLRIVSQPKGKYEHDNHFIWESAYKAYPVVVVGLFHLYLKCTLFSL